ncbi:MAG: hypothetical protein QM756_28600 [Polyangiaceae bacterium]
MRTAVEFWVALGFACAACSAPKPPPPKPVPMPVASSAVARYLPLLDATVLAFDSLAEQSGDKGLLVLEIRRPRPNMAELSVAGRVRRLEIDDSGVRHATGGYLLKPPLELHAKFPGDFGMVEITAVDKAVSVPAGNFSGCVETTEELNGADFHKRTVTSFCPDVGIVARRTEAESNEGNAVESLKLRSHGPRVDLESAPGARLQLDHGSCSSASKLMALQVVQTSL